LPADVLLGQMQLIPDAIDIGEGPRPTPLSGFMATIETLWRANRFYGSG
jgi:hypothetical protein